MTWSLETSDGNESRKVRLEILPYVRGRGLDLGCGPWKVFPHAIGVDAQAYPGGDGANLVADVTDLGMFADAAFDWVYSSHTLEDQEDTVDTLREWWRLVKPGGYLILYLPHKDFYPNIGQPGANPAHKHDFVPADVIAAMREVGGGWDLEICQERNGGNEYSFLQVFRKTGQGFVESWQEPRPDKKAAVVRYGAFGDALWASSLFPALKAQGYHVTVYTQEAGEEALRHDPHVDRIIVHSEYLLPATDMQIYWLHERPKYDRWINLVHTVEATMLPALQDPAFLWEDDVRRQLWSNVNYIERVHQIAQMPFDPKTSRQRFYPTAEEVEWARAKRAEFDGDVVVVQPQGSTWPKWWPYTEAFAKALAERGVHCVVIGDYRGPPPNLPEKYGHFVGRSWGSIRKAMTFAALADVVVGEESALVNAVAFEAPLKVVLLSHSTQANLTRDWPNTISLEPDPAQVACYPCHRLHATSHFCTIETKVSGGAAACQAVALPGAIVEVIDEYRKWRAKEAA